MCVCGLGEGGGGGGEGARWGVGWWEGEERAGRGEVCVCVGGADGAITRTCLSTRATQAMQMKSKNGLVPMCTGPFGWTDQSEKRPLRLFPPKAGSRRLQMQT